MLTVAILAGGKGTRLLSIAKTQPKALIKVLGKPFIFYQLYYLQKQGIKKVVICTGHMGEMIRSAVGDGSKFNLKISYSSDGSKLLGTGGAIKKALPKLGDEFFILYGDTFLPINFNLVQEVYFLDKYPLLMTVLKNNGQWDRSNVLLKENNLVDYNKQKPTDGMQYIDYGLSIISADIFKNYDQNSYIDLSEIYEELSKYNKIKALEVFERFYEIGTPKSLLETEGYFLKLNKN
jgi:NDP-sugar pyrophosphorylase family protein